MDWTGDALIDQGYRVCPSCWSKPQEQFRTPILPLDPVPIDNPRPEVAILNQNLNGFTQIVGPQGTSLQQPIITELDPTNPFTAKAQLLASAATGWGLPQPSLTDRSGSIAISGVPVLIAAANPSRKYLLAYNPASAGFGIAQGSPILGSPGTVIVGTGSALLQNTLATPPSAIWQGAVYALGLMPGAPLWVWEG